MITDGTMFVVPHNTDRCVELLVVRHHPDDQELILVVPCDDTPITEPIDVDLQAGRPLTARCGMSAWVEAQNLKECVGAVSAEALHAVRSMLADLARGRFPESAGKGDYADYYDLMCDLARVVYQVEAK